MKTVIYFIRHGQVDNPDNVLYGRLPGFHLSPNGCRQAQETAIQLRKLHIDYLYTSPLLRARQTAKIIGKEINKKPMISHLLKEVRLIFEGMNVSVYKRDIQPYLYENKYLKRGQESIEEIWDRMMIFVKMVYRKHGNAQIVAVSHGDPILILKAKACGHEFTWKYKKDNYLETAGWIKTEYDGQKLIIASS